MDTVFGWPLFFSALLASPAPPARASPKCPDGMRRVVGSHVERAVYNVCNATKFGTCTGYERDNVTLSGSRAPVDVCMDEYEAPNERGKRPFVMRSGDEADAWCAARNKRLCTEYEWETACEGPSHAPFSYGWRADETCNTQRPWKPFNAWILMQGGAAAEAETERLWQGDRSGERASCVTPEGVHDLLGNAEEWVKASRNYSKERPLVLMGGHWAKPWQTCRMTNYAHESLFRFYEVGFRCCRDPAR